jgi:hypothetical protein
MKTAVKQITPAIAFFTFLLNPNVLVKRIRIKHANWGTGTITFNATTTNLAAGNYTYIATDANGCSITVTINGPAEIAFTATPTQPKCFGEKDP